MHRTTPRKLIPAAAAALALLALPAGSAQAASDCQFDPATAELRVQVAGQGAEVRLARGAGGVILVDDDRCETATTANTDSIFVTGATGPQRLVVDHSAGLFAPGKTPEPGQTSEIELYVNLGNTGELPLHDEVRIKGAAGNDYLRFGGTSAFLTADADADLLTLEVEAFGAEGGAGNDRLLGTGDGAGGAPSRLPLHLDGGAGTDTLAGGASDDALAGGAGNDTESGHAGTDTFRQDAAANGRDVIDGGESPYDSVDYSARTAGVRIDLDGVADDGAPGELDDVKDTVEQLTGGAGPDALVASQTRYHPFRLSGSGGGDSITGGANSDLIDGGAGDDAIDGGAGSDDIAGGAGNDKESGGPGADTFNQGNTPDGGDDIAGGPGHDHYSAWDRRTALTVTMADEKPNDGAAGEGDNVRADVERVTTGLGKDRITGNAAEFGYISAGAGDDVVDGGPGVDEIWGRYGRDTLRGGDGEDKVYGGEDADSLDGGADRDRVYGGQDADTLRGGLGMDRVIGEMGDDTLVEPSTPDVGDVLDGGFDIDRVSYAARALPVDVSFNFHVDDGSQGENDELLQIEDATGGAGGDTLTGDGLANALDGGRGADRLTGGAGEDRLTGGAGADRLDGGADRDLADYSAATAPLSVSLNSAGADDGAAGEGDDADTEDVLGGSGADQLSGGDEVNVLDGGDGDDTLNGGLGNDTIKGGADKDTVSYAGRPIAVTVNLGARGTGGQGGETDTIAATVENARGGARGDTLIGDPGANVLSGGEGDDRLEGGTGADLLDGEGGRDIADYGTRTTPLSLSAGGQADDGADADGDGQAEEGDTILAEILQGGDGDDRLTGGTTDDELLGGKGDDRLQGGPVEAVTADGDDVLAGGDGTDTASYAMRVAGDEVRATLDGVANDGRRDGTEHDDVQADVENLVGGAADDILVGDDDANVLNGGPAGRDTLQGGGGDDRLDESADPADPAADADSLQGGDGTDVADYSGRSAGLRISLNDTAGDGALPTDERAGEDDNVRSDVEAILGGGGGDILSGTARPNRIDGGGGTDAIGGGGGDDELLGGDDNDRVNGGTGNDRIVGGAGSNTLLGGSGDDVIAEAATAAGRDWFIGGSGQDTVDYSARALPVILDNDGAADDGQDADEDGTAEEGDRVSADIEAMMGGAGDDRLAQRLTEPRMACAPALFGGAGDDHLAGELVDETLDGGPGHDTLNAAAGDDFLIGGPGDDMELGGTGQDTFVQAGGTVPCDRTKFVPKPIEGGDGADLLSGSYGLVDRVYYARTASTPVSISSNAKADDGTVGEGDSVSKIEVIHGGAGDDTIAAGSDWNDIYPGPGDDHVSAGDGEDKVTDLHGRDVIDGGAGHDDIDVWDRDNADTIDGGADGDGGRWDEGDRVTGMP